MLKDKEIRKRIIKRLEKIPDERLNTVWQLVKEIETKNKKKAEILKYAGCWKDIDQEILNDLTFNLEKIRNQDRKFN
jgi:hypothetical protein